MLIIFLKKTTKHNKTVFVFDFQDTSEFYSATGWVSMKSVIIGQIYRKNVVILVFWLFVF